MHISSSYAKISGETNFQPREFPRSGSKAKDGKDTPGTRGGQGGRDRMLAVFFLLFTASVWSRKPGPTIVPGVFAQLIMFQFPFVPLVIKKV